MKDIDINKKRCRWCNLENDIYIKYHDEEWGKLNLDVNIRIISSWFILGMCIK